MRIAFLILVLTGLSFTVNAQRARSRAEQSASLFDAYIQEALLTWKTPGLSVAIVKDGNLVFKKAYGVREKGKQDLYKTSTLSTCASTTKAMTAVCMGMLVDEGKVKWTDLVADILPDFKLADPYPTSQITIRDLFTHNAGLGNADLLWVFGYPRSEILHRMQYVPFAYSLRSGFIYQNLMYIVAGEVILKLTGKTWDDFITEHLFKPLNMNNSFSDYSKAPDSEKTGLHFKDNDTIKVISYTEDDNIGPAGGVWSCADDMARWMQFLQDSARVNGVRLLKPETFAELFKPQVMVTDSEFYPTRTLTKPHWKTYGLGWFQQDYRGNMVQFHTGSLSGLVSILGMIPEQHCSIYVFGNLDHSEIRHALMFKAFDLWCFNDSTKNWSALFYKLYKDLADSAKAKEQEANEKRIMNTHPSLPLKSYTGKFVNTLYGSIEVAIGNDSLVLHLPKRYSVNLSHWNFDTFSGTFNNWWFGKTKVQFLLDASGAVSGFLMDDNLYKREKSG
jgi:CubicO group peptidase (beta-lactamase class C family)